MASRISGVTPAAISILLVHLKKMGLLNRAPKDKRADTIAAAEAMAAAAQAAAQASAESAQVEAASAEVSAEVTHG